MKKQETIRTGKERKRSETKRHERSKTRRHKERPSAGSSNQDHDRGRRCSHCPTNCSSTRSHKSLGHLPPTPNSPVNFHPQTTFLGQLAVPCPRPCALWRGCRIVGGCHGPRGLYACCMRVGRLCIPFAVGVVPVWL